MVNTNKHICSVDTLCVTPAEKAAYQRQNDRALKRRNFYASQKTFGLNACRPGYIWRNIDEYDYACVSADRKTQVDQENTSGKTFGLLFCLCFVSK